jgi:hypothetical protein
MTLGIYSSVCSPEDRVSSKTSKSQHHRHFVNILPTYDRAKLTADAEPMSTHISGLSLRNKSSTASGTAREGPDRGTSKEHLIIA